MLYCTPWAPFVLRLKSEYLLVLLLKTDQSWLAARLQRMSLNENSAEHVIKTSRQQIVFRSGLFVLGSPREGTAPCAEESEDKKCEKSEGRGRVPSPLCGSLCFSGILFTEPRSALHLALSQEVHDPKTALFLPYPVYTEALLDTVIH